MPGISSDQGSYQDQVGSVQKEEEEKSAKGNSTAGRTAAKRPIAGRSTTPECPQENAIVKRAEEEDRPLREAASNAEPRHKDGYKPNKYDYTTFDKLRDRKRQGQDHKA
ncbi:hypothetical protein CLCR_07713 [Cladophialophora carrionii]|uniref:Uncharacterized protein n=1 Tax=Cladophialophora carrionii TaxID=86049 RepID=A0A1C1CMK1_9EURO|nr:hypothetical protein CLCR_07713 [Cladophialophora carrionii]